VTTITFRVFGQSEPKGSTKAFVRKVGGKMRAVTTSANPNLAGWERLVKFEAQTALRLGKHDACPFFDGPVVVELGFGLLRPPSVTARKRPCPIVKPDLDKLIRAAIDPLTGVLFRDDCQVVTVRATKVYLDKGPAFADIRVSEFVSPLTPTTGVPACFPPHTSV
jgi:Holliday junction resolvase RusA-like endonuclease